jgi:hypothetical protein
MSRILTRALQTTTTTPTHSFTLPKTTLATALIRSLSHSKTITTAKPTTPTPHFTLPEITPIRTLSKMTAVIPRGPVTASLKFYSPPSDGSAPENFITATGHTTNYTQTPYPVPIEDIRGRESSFTLDNDAFQIISDVPPSAETEFVDDTSIAEKYYPEVEALLRQHIPGVTKVIIFDHTVRRTDPAAPRNPVTSAHIDQTAKSAAQRVHRHVEDPAEAEALLKGRYRIINVWRTINKKPVESWPLAFASSATFRDEDLIPVAHRYESGYTGQTAAIKHNPDQKWYYLSGVEPNERILLECFDSEATREGSQVKGGRVPHTAFEDPRSREDAEGRESIEVRTLVFGP